MLKYNGTHAGGLWHLMTLKDIVLRSPLQSKFGYRVSNGGIPARVIG